MAITQTVKIKVEKQAVSVDGEYRLVANSVGIYDYELELDEEWDDVESILVAFISPKITKVVDYKAGQTIIPWEALEYPGTLQVGVVGVNSDGTQKNTVYVDSKGGCSACAMTNGITVMPSVASSSTPTSSPDPSPDIWVTIQKEIGDLLELETTDKSNLVNAINEVLSVAGDKDFNDLENRPRYAGELMTGDTNIPDVDEAVEAEATARAQAISAEATARTQAISAEATVRAEAISAESSAREQAINAEASARQTAISDEASARQQAVATETSARQTAIANLDSAKVDKVTGKGLSTNDYTTAEKTKLAGLENYDDTEIREEISEIKEVIPEQATASNQLADKEFVNSSIATNTAIFRGTYNSVAELPTTGVTNNDYAFVVIYDTEQPTVVKQYDRYKYNGSAWVFEYTLNNSSFTAGQWAAINSGITSGKITEIEAAIAEKVDKVAGKGLSTNDYTTAEKSKLADLENYDDTEVRNLINGRQATLISGTNIKTVNNQSLLGAGNITIEGGGNVDDVKVNGTSVVTDKVANIDLTNYVEKEAGKGLSTNDYTTTEKTKLAGIEAGAEVNSVEDVRVNGTSVVDENKVAHVVGMETENRGEIFNDYENNQAYTSAATAAGNNNISGTKTIRIIKIEGERITTNINTTPIEVGWEVSLYIPDRGNIDFAGRVDSVDPQSRSFTVNRNLGNYPEPGEAYMWFPEHPDIAFSDWTNFGIGAFTHGRDNKANHEGSIAMGKGNVVSGKYAFANGKNNTASYASLVSGAENKVKGQCCEVSGSYNEVYLGANYNTLGGKYNIALGEAGTAFGQGLVVNGVAQTVLGQYNVQDNTGTYQLIVGNGVDVDHKHNAFAVKRNGDTELSGKLVDASNAPLTQTLKKLGALVKLTLRPNSTYTLFGVSGIKITDKSVSPESVICQNCRYVTFHYTRIAGADRAFMTYVLANGANPVYEYVTLNNNSVLEATCIGAPMFVIENALTLEQ